MADTFGTRTEIEIQNQKYHYYSLPTLAKKLNLDLDLLPYSHKVLLENLLRHEDGRVVKKADVEFMAQFDSAKTESREIQYHPARVLLQDFTGVPVIADLASFRDAVVEGKGDWKKVNPLQQVDLVIDHSVQVDVFARPDAIDRNAALEFERNGERYEFLKWGQGSFENLRVIPPATGICHQVNLEFISPAAYARNGEIFPDTVIGTDSHTPMINALGVVGWGVGGIEAEAAMLGQPMSLLIPPVVGFELTGELRPGMTATDLVLTVTQMLRKKGVVGKFVEFFGDGVRHLSIADRATIGNMSPEYGATIGIFPPDERTMEYLKNSGRAREALRAEAYYKAQNMWGVGHLKKARYEDTLRLDLSKVETSLAGPSKPHERMTLPEAPASLAKIATPEKMPQKVHVNAENESFTLETGAIVIAAITSCTNTSNPSLMIASGLVAKRAVEKGLKVPPWVKTSFAPGSKVVAEYMEEAGLLKEMDKIGFGLVGFGCTTCIGNSGPLPPAIGQAIEDNKLVTTSVLSGNRNFEARIHPQVMGNYLMSPPLVVAYAFAGNIKKDLTKEPLAVNDKGQEVFLKDIWPSPQEIEALVHKHVTVKKYEEVYGRILEGDKNWNAIKSTQSPAYTWSESSSYIQRPPFLEKRFQEEAKATEIRNARILAILGDFVTTDHISPAGSIGTSTPAGLYLKGLGIDVADFNSYGSRRGNHHVMVRGTFANIRLKNKMASKEGGWTTLQPEGREMTIFDASEAYEDRQVPVVVFAGKEYGSGSSRDWAAKGPRLLGVRAVVAEGFERIHRSNLVGMGVLPLQFMDGQNVESLGLKGDEEIDIPDLDKLQPQAVTRVIIHKGPDRREINVKVRIDTPNELDYFRAGGILPFVLKQLMA
ncbi:MAG: aconitate hydratase AcnA [Bdellovibrionaceae bacterium]|nr:aconitate hydratase AcnA [Pseudobdellovibrionaceae bacterium]MBX3032337.1 aconitate hydratase AcnA [Pseudobdellovibrionaceae bacterium]